MVKQKFCTASNKLLFFRIKGQWEDKSATKKTSGVVVSAEFYKWSSCKSIIKIRIESYASSLL